LSGFESNSVITKREHCGVKSHEEKRKLSCIRYPTPDIRFTSKATINYNKHFVNLKAKFSEGEQ